MESDAVGVDDEVVPSSLDDGSRKQITVTEFLDLRQLRRRTLNHYWCSICVMENLTTVDGSTVHVDPEEWVRGSKGPFFAVYTTADRSTRYGFQCSNCGTLDNAMDSMGRIVCNECGNTKKADEWDAAHE